ncbi:MAG: ABC transporter permease subunit [Steroidobacteraceae bacterium]
MSDAAAGQGGAAAMPAARGFWSDAARRLGRNRAAMASLAIIALIAALALAGPQFSPHAFDAIDWDHMAVAPGTHNAHWFGTDRLGRDLFVRTLYGVRVSLQIGLLATLVSLLIGVGWGATAGYLGGRIDELMMRFVDVLYALPYIFIVIILSTLFERGNILVLFLAIGAVGWLTMARIVRGQTLALKRREFVEAAIAGGVGTAGILARHIVPNVIGPVIIYATLTIPQMILFESFLSFLGLGVQEPQASLGSLINEGAQEMESAAWMLLVPASFLVALLTCFNFLGDGLRRATSTSRPPKRCSRSRTHEAAGDARREVVAVQDFCLRCARGRVRRRGRRVGGRQEPGVPRRHGPARRQRARRRACAPRGPRAARRPAAESMRRAACGSRWCSRTR